jgi:hypothetical protein
LAGYFLDTSALAKLYHEELGSDYVESILNQPGSKGIVSRLSLVEMESVFAIKVRTGALDENRRSLALRRPRAGSLDRQATHRTETLIRQSAVHRTSPIGRFFLPPFQCRAAPVDGKKRATTVWDFGDSAFGRLYSGLPPGSASTLYFQ